MRNLRQAAQQALEALEDVCGGRCNAEYNPCFQREVATALRAALAEPEQEPVACISAEQLSKMFNRLEGIDQNQWGYHWKKGWNDALRQAMDYCHTAPTPRKPLTDEQIVTMYAENPSSDAEMIEFARAIERAHGIGGGE